MKQSNLKAVNPNKDNYFDLDKHKDKLIVAVTRNYVQGGQKVTKDKTPVRPKSSDIKNITRDVADLIKGVTDEMSKKIRLTVRDSIVKGESKQQLAKRLDNIFKGDNPTSFNYKKRLQLIARTEKARAQNSGATNSAKKLGFKKKYIAIVLDNRTTAVSKAMFKKYGSKEKAIPIDEEFSVIVNGKTYGGQYPPFMPNDRDSVNFTF